MATFLASIATELTLALTYGAAWPLAVLVAMVLDGLLGEPPVRWHPVVWMGAYLGWAGQRVAPLVGMGGPGHRAVFTLGALAWSVGAAGVVLVAISIEVGSAGWPWWLQGLVLGVLLKPLLAWRMLRDEVLAVELALSDSLNAGRARLSRLVSRDVTVLDANAVRESAIETLAENLNDSVVAPLFWFAVAGLPGAALYRFANTADAMWGYRGERQGRDWAWAGKWAARADDVLSWLPARLTALLLWPAWRHWARLRAEAARTPSPNGGWPMGAMALRLGVRLGKPGDYVLNGQAASPSAADTARSLRIAARAAWLAAGLAATLTIMAACALRAGRQA